MSATSTMPSLFTSPGTPMEIRKSRPSAIRLVSQTAPSWKSNFGVPSRLLARKIRILSPSCSVLDGLRMMRIVPLIVSLLMSSMEVHPLTVAVAHRPAVICNTPCSSMVTGLEPNVNVPVLKVAMMPGRRMPLTVVLELLSGLLELLPERVASAATVSFPVPSPDEVPKLISPSLIVLVPVLVLLPFQVIFP